MALHRKSVVVMVAVAALAAGCGSSSDPQGAVKKVQEYRAKNDHKAAIIEIKNLLQKNADNAEARYLLGITYHDSRNYRLAEQELRRALDLNYDRNKVMPALARSLLMLGEFQKVLDQMPVNETADAAAQADVLTLRARAQMGLGQRDKARELLGQALAKCLNFRTRCWSRPGSRRESASWMNPRGWWNARLRVRPSTLRRG